MASGRDAIRARVRELFETVLRAHPAESGLQHDARFNHAIIGEFAAEDQPYAREYLAFCRQQAEVRATVVDQKRDDGRKRRFWPMPDDGTNEPFELVQRIHAHGTETSVWIARSPDGESQVVKLLDPDSDRARYALEAARKVKRSQDKYGLDYNQNLVKIFYVGPGRDNEGKPVVFIAMKLVRGCTLAEWRARQEPSGREIAAATIALVTALDSLTVATSGEGQGGGALVERPLLHLDLSPANILVEGDSESRLLPASLRIIDFVASAGLRTVGFAAPERSVPESKAAESWDVYSLGAVMYFLVTGTPPPQPPEQTDDFARLPASLDRELRAIIQKSMSVDPEKRFQTRKDLAVALTAYVHDYPVADVGLNYSPLNRFTLLRRRAQASENVVAQSKMWALVYLWCSINIGFWLALCWLLPSFGVDRMTAFDATGRGLTTCTALAAIFVGALTWRGALSRQLVIYTLVYLAAYWILRARIAPDFSKAASIQVLLSACFAILIGVSQRAWKVWAWIGAGLLALAWAAPRITESAAFGPVQDATLQAGTLAVWALGFALTFGLTEERMSA